MYIPSMSISFTPPTLEAKEYTDCTCIYVYNVLSQLHTVLQRDSMYMYYHTHLLAIIDFRVVMSVPIPSPFHCKQHIMCISGGEDKRGGGREGGRARGGGGGGMGEEGKNGRREEGGKDGRSEGGREKRGKRMRKRSNSQQMLYKEEAAHV